MDLERVRDAYANMYNEELLNFAKNDGLKITTDAFLILKEELTKRNIGADILKGLEHEIMLHVSLNSRRLSEDVNRNLFHEAIEFSLTQKQNGSSNYDIYVGLIEMGVSEKYSNRIINKLPEWTDGLHKDSNAELQAGVVTLILGIIAMYIAISIERFEIGAAMLLLLGIVKIIIWTTKKNQYQKILDQLRTEEENDPN